MTLMTRLSRFRVRFGVLLAGLLLGAASCVDGPFARVNPNDQDFEFSMAVVTDRDSLSAANPVVVARLVTDPAIADYDVQWSSLSAQLQHLGGGIFEMLPGTAPSFIIRARFQHRSAQRLLYRAP